MGKPTICICENKDTDQLCSYFSAQLISIFVFAIRIVLSLFLNPKFQASSLTAGLCRSWSETQVVVSSRTGSNRFDSANIFFLNLYIVYNNYVRKKMVQSKLQQAFSKDRHSTIFS